MVVDNNHERSLTYLKSRSKFVGKVVHNHFDFFLRLKLQLFVFDAKNVVIQTVGRIDSRLCTCTAVRYHKEDFAIKFRLVLRI